MLGVLGDFLLSLIMARRRMFTIAHQHIWERYLRITTQQFSHGIESGIFVKALSNGLWVHCVLSDYLQGPVCVLHMRSGFFSKAYHIDIDNGDAPGNIHRLLDQSRQRFHRRCNAYLDYPRWSLSRRLPCVVRTSCWCEPLAAHLLWRLPIQS